MQDITIICRNCGKEFKFTVGEQRFYEEKGLVPPVRCKECKAKRKAEQEEREQKEKENNFEDMLEKFKENTVIFEEERERRERKRK